MLDTVSGHFILRRMILSLFFFGLCRLALFILYGTGYGYAGCVYYCFFASSCLVVSFACCNEVMIHGNMGDVMDWDLFSLLLSLSVYYSYRSVSILPIPPRISLTFSLLFPIRCICIHLQVQTPSYTYIPRYKIHLKKR